MGLIRIVDCRARHVSTGLPRLLAGIPERGAGTGRVWSGLVLVTVPACTTVSVVVATRSREGGALNGGCCGILWHVVLRRMSWSPPGPRLHRVGNRTWRKDDRSKSGRTDDRDVMLGNHAGRPEPGPEQVVGRPSLTP